MSQLCVMQAAINETAVAAVTYANAVSGMVCKNFADFNDFLWSSMYNYGNDEALDALADQAAQSWLTAYFDAASTAADWIDQCLWPFMACDLFSWDEDCDIAANAVQTRNSGVMADAFLRYAGTC